MSDFIYFNSSIIAENDYKALLSDYEFHKWFQLHSLPDWPGHITSRTHQLATPWSLAPTVCPIPELTHNQLDFGKVIESIAESFCKKVNRLDLVPYVAWSGGIDSTSILVSLLKVGNQEFLKKLVVLCNEVGIKENPYFYSRFINNKLKTQNISEWEITAENYDKIILVDGECGNQCYGWRSIHQQCYFGNFDFLNQSWALGQNLARAFYNSNEFMLELVQDSAKLAPIDVRSVHDIIWWTNFNFKFDEALLRKVLDYTKNLTAEQTKKFYQHHLFRFFAQPDMQVWSMLTPDIRREHVHLAPKWILKNYIYQFDHNDLYLYSKSEQPSKSPMETSQEKQTVIAVDVDWNKYYITDSSTRRTVGKILKRI
jgi:hypothetical protein